MTIVLDGSAGITNDGGYTGDGVVFADTTPANTLVTTTGGNVGIGTSSPEQKMDIRNSTGRVSIRLSSGATNQGFIGYFNDTQTLSFGNGNPTGTGVNGGQQVNIDASGNLLVGTTGSGYRFCVQSSSGADVTAIHALNAVSGTYFIRFGVGSGAFPGTLSGSISYNGTGTNFNTASDYRLKENIAPMQGALSMVARLKPCTYTWKADGSDGEGFVAHELAEVFPGAVTGEKDAVDAEGNPVYQGIDTSFLVATLTAAIQEQQAIITALTARVAALEGK